MYRVVNLHSYLTKNAEHYIFTHKPPAKCENEEQYQSFSQLLKKKSKSFTVHIEFATQKHFPSHLYRESDSRTMQTALQSTFCRVNDHARSADSAIRQLGHHCVTSSKRIMSLWMTIMKRINRFRGLENYYVLKGFFWREMLSSSQYLFVVGCVSVCK